MTRYYTPLRYPGGKQRLAPFVREILVKNDAIGWNYVEPYAGGAGVAIELLLSGSVGRVYLNDSSPHIYAVWSALLGDTDAFCRKISAASLSVEAWRRHREVVRHPANHSTDDLGFSTFYLNRCNRSGVLTAGIIGGQAQDGRWRVDARFPRNELIKRVERIATRSSDIVLSNLDAEKFMRSKVNRLSRETFVYCDPPYYARAHRLYLSGYLPKDHGRLAQFIQYGLRRPWIVSYDNHPVISELYHERRRITYSIGYSAVRAYTGSEIFVFSDGLFLPADSRLPSIAKALSESHS